MSDKMPDMPNELREAIAYFKDGMSGLKFEGGLKKMGRDRHFVKILIRAAIQTADIAPTSQWRDIDEEMTDYSAAKVIEKELLQFSNLFSDANLARTVARDVAKRLKNKNMLATPPTKDLADAGKEGV